MNYTPYFITSFISFLLAVVFPIALLLVWRKKTHASWLYLGVGALIFMVFALGLEQMLHVVVGSFMPQILLNAGSYVLYGCLAAGLFEETGRLLAFSMLKYRRNRENSVMYGIGHGGVEALLLVGVSFAYQLVVLVVLMTGGEAALVNMLGELNADVTLESLAVAAPIAGLAGGIERFSTIIFHISMSVVVFYGVKSEKSAKYWLIAVLSHAFVNAFAALWQVQLLTNIWLVEAIVLVLSLAAAYYAFTLYQKMKDLPKEDGDLMEMIAAKE